MNRHYVQFIKTLFHHANKSDGTYKTNSEKVSMLGSDRILTGLELTLDSINTATRKSFGECILLDRHSIRGEGEFEQYSKDSTVTHAHARLICLPNYGIQQS